MAISDAIIAEARVNPINSALAAIGVVTDLVEMGGDWDEESLDVLIETFAFITALLELVGPKSVPTPPKIAGKDISSDCRALYEYLKSVRTIFTAEATQLKLSDQTNRFKLALGSVFSYEFSQGDLDRVQTLLNELRDLIAKVEGLNEEHRQRVLASLEKLQRELHKKVSDFDRFYGVAAQLSSLMHKVGTDSKPIIDRMREVLGIAWETQARGDELPSGTEPPLLPKPEALHKLPKT